MSEHPTVKCPGCGKQTVWRKDNPDRPFCSASCRNQDFVAWANEDHRIPGQPDFDDILSQDLENAQLKH